MALTTAYLLQVKNLKDIFESIKQAQAPDKFTIKFLNELGFSSTNDRPIVNVLKGLGFLDDNGAPSQRYFEFLDNSNSKRVLADGIKEAYADLFRINNEAQNMSGEELKGKLKTLLQGAKGEQFIQKMSTTFTSLCSLADFSKSKVKPIEKKEPQVITKETEKPVEIIEKIVKQKKSSDFNLKYSINIELPLTRDKAVYDAIFKSLKENIL